MGVSASLLVIALLMAVSAFFSVAEISLAASRRLRLRQMAEEGNDRAQSQRASKCRSSPATTSPWCRSG